MQSTSRSNVDALSRAAEDITREIQTRRAALDRPMAVGIDGGSGAGKSTLAAALTCLLPVAIVNGDDFYAAQIPDAGWDARTVQQRAADAIDWRRIRHEALEPLRAGNAAQWYAFDFEAGRRSDGTYPVRNTATVVKPAPVIVLEGLFSCRPELLDLIDLTVLVDVPEETRRGRLADREEPVWLAEWHARWDEAVEFYLTRVRPPQSYDLVLRLDNSAIEDR